MFYSLENLNGESCPQPLIASSNEGVIHSIYKTGDERKPFCHAILLARRKSHFCYTWLWRDFPPDGASLQARLERKEVKTSADNEVFTTILNK